MVTLSDGWACLRSGQGLGCFTPANGSDYRDGWTAGGGIEVRFAPNWSFKAEYLYVDLGNKVMFNVAPSVPEWVSVRTNLVRVGINYQSR